MRELTTTELEFVSGGRTGCTRSSPGNSYGGITRPSSLGQDLINIYEGMIQATSYMIERVATSWGW
jgi:hypothetical protein